MPKNLSATPHIEAFHFDEAASSICKEGDRFVFPNPPGVRDQHFCAVSSDNNECHTDREQQQVRRTQKQNTEILQKS
jgi:hypothetical protein